MACSYKANAAETKHITSLAPFEAGAGQGCFLNKGSGARVVMKPHPSLLPSNHGKQHLETLVGEQGVGMVSGHDNHFACLNNVRHTIDFYLCFAV